MFTDLKKKNGKPTEFMTNQQSKRVWNGLHESHTMEQRHINKRNKINEEEKIDKLRIAREREQLRNKGSTFYTPLSSRMLPFLSLPLALAGNPHHLMHTILNDLDQEFVQIQ